MRNLRTNLFAVIFFMLTFTIQGMLSEIRVKYNDGSTSTEIEIYKYFPGTGGYLFFDSGWTIVDTSPYAFHAKCDVGGNNTSNPTWQPLSFNSHYLRYCNKH